MRPPTAHRRRMGARPAAVMPARHATRGSGSSGVVVTAIAAGEGCACALLPNGTVECWGYGGYGGELGRNGTMSDAVTPVAVTGLTDVTAISVGGSSACALLTNGTVDCWGDNEFGQLGNGTTSNSLTPVAVSGLTGVTAIVAGQSTTLRVALERHGRLVGDNSDGGAR